MRARFLHFADCHLGYRQYNNSERYNDFARAFLYVIDAAIQHKVDFVVLAGDLFQKRTIDALTLNQAIRGLDKLHNAGIPCLAVEGNHELAYFHDTIGWMEFLALRRLVILLNAKAADGVMQLTPYSARSGAYYDVLPWLRVYGLRYQGSSTAATVEAYAQSLAKQPPANLDYTLFIAHAGVEEALPEQGGGLSLRQWSALQPFVNYLALGHVHKPFQFDGWIHNPGSLESCSIAESEWPERGYYLVDIDTEQNDAAAKHSTTLHSIPRRRFFRQTLKTDLLASPQELYEQCERLLQRKADDWGLQRLPADQRPVVELCLTGQLNFERSLLDLRKIEAIVQTTTTPLLPLLRNLTHAPGVVIEAAESLSRSELEQQVLSQIFAQDGRYQAQNEQWAKAALAMKRLALQNVDAQSLVDELAGLVDKISNKSDE
jgi:DNA repair exonuclease SbcCD nuclease subunit